ncbi:hypothetical protein [Alkaliphilus hydrothermalis]|uniref:Uncharacterized protein n=1 Tax=Alkaliphilus hydrothermalis TaxID=1482730 RepID=A0ABS2NNG0_9FIRM|nr:hypothetical protein [Alkaliphilus hydrothermalis]MBM7614442.1 hypothetical protein [Alkaliphilus hydrothermalis]
MEDLTKDEKKFILDLIVSVKKVHAKQRKVITPPQRKIIDSIWDKMSHEL